ncbi:MAG: SH3 domain-containing protein [Spirochaetales bacterium]|nr:SH3 domain-containing protein [Spirochaetales bacterium]
MRRVILLILIYLTYSSAAVAGPLVIEITTKEVIERVPRFGSTYSIYMKENKIFFSQGEKCTIVDLDDYSIEVLNPETTFFRVLGEYGDNFLINKYFFDDAKQDYRFTFHTYNPKTTEIDYFKVPKEVIGNKDYINHFINNQFFFTIAEGEDGHTSFIYDIVAGEKIGRFPGRFADITPDRIHSLWVLSNGLYIYNHSSQEWLSTSPIAWGETSFFMVPSIYFINNELFLYTTSSKYQMYSVFNIKGEELLKFKYVPEDGNMHSYGFVKIEDSEYGNNFGILMKAEGEIEALRDLGLLFKPTTGTANDSRVRIREYALLEAKHLGYLSTGDKLEILDRSGIKVKIGDMEDYWYKIRRPSDGMEGWSYGAFIDVDEAPPTVDDGSPKSYRILDFDPTEVKSYK